MLRKIKVKGKDSLVNHAVLRWQLSRMPGDVMPVSCPSCGNSSGRQDSRKSPLLEDGKVKEYVLQGGRKLVHRK